jgi:CHAT domain-containing protein
MPGFHTPAENGLKATRTQKFDGNGDDLFLTSLALEACGAKTVLLSRWKTGGRASYNLVGEFLLNFQTFSAADAWRQAILTVGGNPLEPDQEPRVKLGPDDQPPTAAHPFFWGAFILIDRGENPASADPGSKLE